MIGKQRASIAIAAALLLTGAGVAAVANGVASSEPPAETTAVEQPAVAPDAGSTKSSTLQLSVEDLLAQVSELESTVAAVPDPVVVPAPVVNAGPGAGGQQTVRSAPAAAQSAPAAAAPAAAPAPAPLPAPPAQTHERDDDDDEGDDHEAEHAESSHGEDDDHEQSDDGDSR